MSGSTTIFSGERILAVSAMNLTPQKAITSASVSAALRHSSRRIADEIGEVLHLGLLVIMRQDDRVALLAQAVDLGAQVGAGGEGAGQVGHRNPWRLDAKYSRRESEIGPAARRGNGGGETGLRGASWE